MALSINYVYQIVRDILQKDARGFITPVEFNRLATYAQEEVFQDIYALYTRALQKRTNRLEYKDLIYNSITQIEDDLMPCKRNGVSLAQVSANNFSYPSDYKYFISCSYNGITCEELRESTDYVLNSRTAPTTAYPAVERNYNVITAYPTSITSGLTLTYYKIPRSLDASGNPSSNNPTWAYDIVGGQSVYNSTNSYQFELPESTYNKIIVRILQLSGMSIREAEVVAFAGAEEVEDINQE